jgi:hypothetical protein
MNISPMQLWYPQLANIHNSTLAKEHLLMSSLATFPTVTPACYIHRSTLIKEHLALPDPQPYPVITPASHIKLSTGAKQYFINSIGIL